MLRISFLFQAGTKSKRNAPIKGKNNTQRRSDIMKIFCFGRLEVCTTLPSEGVRWPPPAGAQRMLSKEGALNPSDGRASLPF
jgi:hypothetical protein